jgi:hypothetical protein
MKGTHIALISSKISDLNWHATLSGHLIRSVTLSELIKTLVCSDCQIIRIIGSEIKYNF